MKNSKNISRHLNMIGIVLFCFFVVFLSYVFFRRDDDYLKIPGLPSYPLVGASVWFIGKSSTEIFDLLVSLSKKYGATWRNDIGFSSLYVFLNDPKDLEVVLSSQKMINKGVDYGFMKNWLGDGLLLSSGNKWHARRKIITPAFHFKILEQFCEVFHRQSDVLVKILEQYVDSDGVDVYPLVENCALDIICETSMGVKMHAQTNSSSTYVKAVQEIKTIVYLRMFNFLQRFNFYYKFTKRYRDEMKCSKILHDFTDDIIKARREELKKSKLEADAKSLDDDIGLKGMTAFLDLLLEATVDGEPLSDLDIREEVDTFMFGGHDTVTSAISFALYNLAKYPEIQEKCFEEIRGEFGKEFEGNITINNLNNLQYLELVIKESLRLYPAVPAIARKITEDVVINGKLLKKGWNINIYPIIVGRDPKYFENPEDFLPERFEKVRNPEDNNAFSYIPFSAGPRNCIGQKFAMHEMKSTISVILHHFKLSVADDYEGPKLVMELVLRPLNGIKLKLNKRVK